MPGCRSRCRWWGRSWASSSATPPVTDYASARAAVAGGRYPPFFAAMLEQGVALAPGPYEAMFPGLAHSDDDLDAVVEAAGRAATAGPRRRAGPFLTAATAPIPTP